MEVQTEEHYSCHILRKSMEKTKKYFINREGIGFFKSILESYEDIGIFSVLDGDKGIIEIIYPFNFEKEMGFIIEDMSNYGIIFQEVIDV